MSTRNPASESGYNDESLLFNRKQIKTTLPSTVADDQVFVLDAASMPISDCFVPWRTDAAAYADYWSIKLRLKAMCTVLPAATTINCKFAVYAWAGSASITEFKLRVSDGATTQVITVSADLTSKIWRGLSSTVAYATDADITLTFSAYVSGGQLATRYIYIAGVYLQCEET